MRLKISLVLALACTSLNAHQIKPEHIVPDIGEYTVIKIFACTPDGYNSIMACLVIKKGDRELGSIHDPVSKECYELREAGRKTIWKKGQWFV